MTRGLQRLHVALHVLALPPSPDPSAPEAAGSHLPCRTDRPAVQTWFEDLGGFQREENIPLFVAWAEFMFRTFGSRIRMWATFNEPSVSE
jgi:hypothetical protein